MLFNVLRKCKVLSRKWDCRPCSLFVLCYAILLIVMGIVISVRKPGKPVIESTINSAHTKGVCILEEDAIATYNTVTQALDVYVLLCDGKTVARWSVPVENVTSPIDGTKTNTYNF